MDYMQEANAIAVQLRGTGAARAVGARRGGAKPAAAASALQRDVLAFMREFLADEDQLPPLSCLAQRFGMTASGIDWHVQQLVRHGHLERNAVGKLRFARKGGM